MSTQLPTICSIDFSESAFYRTYLQDADRAVKYVAEVNRQLECALPRDIAHPEASISTVNRVQKRVLQEFFTKDNFLKDYVEDNGFLTLKGNEVALPYLHALSKYMYTQASKKDSKLSKMRYELDVDSCRVYGRLKEDEVKDEERMAKAKEMIEQFIDEHQKECTKKFLSGNAAARINAEVDSAKVDF